MRNTLEDFYYGNLTPCDRQVERGSTLKRAMDKAQKREETLTAQLKDDEKSLLEDLLEAQSEINNTLAIENFILGFRLGMRLAVESLDDDDGCLTDMIERER